MKLYTPFIIGWLLFSGLVGAAGYHEYSKQKCHRDGGSYVQVQEAPPAYSCKF